MCLLRFLLTLSVYLALTKSESGSHTGRTIIRLLSTYFIPESYDVRLWPISSESGELVAFNGSLHVLVVCLKSYDHIRLNAYSTVIDQTSVEVFDGTGNQKLASESDISSIASHEIFTIRTTFVRDKWYEISLNFQTPVNENFRGLYKVPYIENETLKYVLATHSKPIETRRIFPYFDEPSYFVPLNLSIARPGHLTTISNAPLSSITSENNGLDWDHYYPLQNSLYLNNHAFVISNFTPVTVHWNDVKKRKLQIHVRNDVVSRVRLVEQSALKLLAFFERYFNLSYPLTKLDFVAIPDIAYGADGGGSLGLVIQKEANFLFDDERSTSLDRQQVLKSMAHSVAKQWIGTFIHVKWWNNVWETEALLNYLQFTAIDATFPKTYRVNDQFVATALQEAFALDAWEKVEPITANPVVIQDIYSKFNSLTLNKGASLIRMCESMIGKQTFDLGIARYLKSPKPSTSLWQTLHDQVTSRDTVHRVDTQKVMEDWTSKPGYPLVRVSRLYNSGNQALISQVGFRINTSVTDVLWTIPLSYSVNFNQTYFEVLDQESATIHLSGDKNQAVYFNVLSTGYYRVVYDDANYAKISAQLLTEHGAILPLNRAQLLDDAFNVAKAGILHYRTALVLTKYLKFERDLIPWMGADKTLGYLDDMLRGTSAYDHWKVHLNSILERFYHELISTGGLPEAHDDALLRTIIFHWMCVRLENSECISKALSQFAANPVNLPPNQRFTIVCTAVVQGGEGEWNFAMVNYLSHSLLPCERLEYLKALGYSKDAKHLNKALHMVLNGNEVANKNDRIVLFKAVASNPTGNSVAIDFFAQHWKQLSEIFDDTLTFGSGPLPLLFRFLCDQVNDINKLNKMKKVYESSDAVLLRQSQIAAHGLEVAEFNVAWIVKYPKVIGDWLKNDIESSNSAASISSMIVSIFVSIIFANIV